MTVKTTGIQRRGNKFYLRIRIPEDCKKALNGKREIIKSLGTDNEIEALTQATMLRAEWQETFKQIRERQENGENEKPTVTPSGKSLEDELKEALHAATYYKVTHALRINHLTVLRHAVEVGIRPQYEVISAALHSDDLTKETLSRISAWGLLGSMQKYGGSRLDVDNVWNFAENRNVQNDRTALRIILRILRNELRYAMDTIFKEFPQLDTIRRSEVQQQLVMPSDEKPKATVKSLHAIMEECLAVKKREPTTQDKIKTEVKYFTEFIGDKSPADYTIQDIKEYLYEGLLKLPVSANSKKETRDLKTMREQIKKGAELELPTLAPRTVNNRYASLGVVFSFAEKHMYIPKSPCVDTLKVEDTKKEQTELIDNSFSNTEVVRIVKLAEKTLKENEKDNSLAWRGWIPLILTYTGARLNEICAMDRDSIQKDDKTGIWYFDLQQDEDRKIKIKGKAKAWRRVPLHPELIERGFIEWFEQLPESHHRLWGRGITYAERGRVWTRNASRYFKDKIKPLILDEGRDETLLEGAHSIRHSFQRKWQELELPQRELDEIVGHAHAGLSDVAKQYQGRLKLDRLHRELAKFSW
ncbi:tyrosine-type recombinase/integrase [Pontiellaceae bacterium B12219]|nr:tyrosine-type recombinase/integrase [Pontiellaceae bacterium B12219]